MSRNPSSNPYPSLPGPRVAVAALALLLLAHPIPSLAAPAASVADTIRALEVARGEALVHADTTALSRMTADEFIEISRFGTLRTKRDNIRDIASGTLKLTTVKYDSVSVWASGDVAVLRGIADNAGTFRGFPFVGKLWYTRIFARRDGRWQAVAMQHTMIQ